MAKSPKAKKATTIDLGEGMEGSGGGDAGQFALEQQQMDPSHPSPASNKYSSNASWDGEVHQQQKNQLSNVSEGKEKKENVSVRSYFHAAADRLPGKTKAKKVMKKIFTTNSPVGQRFKSIREQELILSTLSQADVAKTFHIRAECSPKEQREFENTPFTRSGTSSWRLRAIGWPAHVFRMMMKACAFWLISVMLFLVAFEPTCNDGKEREKLHGFKVMNFSLSIIYIVLSMFERIGFTSVSWQMGMEFSDTADVLPVHFKSPGFWLDLISFCALPLDHANLSQQRRRLPQGIEWFSLLHCFKAWRLFGNKDHAPARTPYVVQVCMLVVSMALCDHVYACISGALSILAVQAGDESWTQKMDPGMGCTERYVASLYFATYTMTAVGFGDIHPQGLIERLWSVVFMLSSAMIMAKVFADLIWITSTHNHWTAEQFSKVTQISNALLNMRVPAGLRHRVLAYIEFVDKMQKERGVKRFFDELSPPLRLELHLATYHGLVSRAPLFKKQPLEVIKMIVCALSDRVYMPLDFIFGEGDVGTELFFIRLGKVSIRARPHRDEPEIAEVLPGAYFGEVAALLGGRRRAWAFAKTYVIASILHKRTLDALADDNPGAFVQLVKVVRNIVNVQSTVSFSQVAAMLSTRYTDSAEAFLAILQDKKGVSITANDLSKFLMQELSLSRLDATLIWAELDEDSNGVIDYEEWCQKVANADLVRMGGVVPQASSMGARPSDLPQSVCAVDTTSMFNPTPNSAQEDVQRPFEAIQEASHPLAEFAAAEPSSTASPEIFVASPTASMNAVSSSLSHIAARQYGTLMIVPMGHGSNSLTPPGATKTPVTTFSSNTDESPRNGDVPAGLCESVDSLHEHPDKGKTLVATDPPQPLNLDAAVRQPQHSNQSLTVSSITSSASQNRAMQTKQSDHGSPQVNATGSSGVRSLPSNLPPNLSVVPMDSSAAMPMSFSSSMPPDAYRMLRPKRGDSPEPHGAQIDPTTSMPMNIGAQRSYIGAKDKRSQEAAQRTLMLRRPITGGELERGVACTFLRQEISSAFRPMEIRLNDDINDLRSELDDLQTKLELLAEAYP